MGLQRIGHNWATELNWSCLFPGHLTTELRLFLGRFCLCLSLTLHFSRLLASSALSLWWTKNKQPGNSSLCHSLGLSSLVCLLSSIFQSLLMLFNIYNVQGFKLYVVGGLGESTSPWSFWKWKLNSLNYKYKSHHVSDLLSSLKGFALHSKLGTTWT